MPGITIVFSWLRNSGLDGAVLTMQAFDQLLPGDIGKFICLVSVVFFCFLLSNETIKMKKDYFKKIELEK